MDRKYKDFADLAQMLQEFAASQDIDFMAMFAADDEQEGYILNMYGSKETMAMMICNTLTEHFTLQELTDLMTVILEVAKKRASRSGLTH